MKPEEKQLWDALLDGQLDIDQLREPLVDNYSPDFIKAIQGIQEMSADLDRDGALMEEILAEARAEPVSAQDRELLQHIPDPTEAPPSPIHSPSFGKRFAPWLVAAAGLLIAVTGYQLSRTAEDPVNPGPQLGGPGEMEMIRPVGPDADFGTFQWKGPSQLGAWYVVHVADEDSDQTWTSEKLSETTWTPAPPIDAQRIRWYVVYHDPATGEAQSSSEASASR